MNFGNLKNGEWWTLLTLILTVQYDHIDAMLLLYYIYEKSPKNASNWMRLLMSSAVPPVSR